MESDSCKELNRKKLQFRWIGIFIKYDELFQSLQIIWIWEGPTRLLVLNSTQLSTSICVRARFNYCPAQRKKDTERERASQVLDGGGVGVTEMENI